MVNIFFLGIHACCHFFKNLSLPWLVSKAEKNLPVFQTIIAAIIPLCWGFHKWKRQKRAEKQIEWAEHSLINLDAFHDKIKDWFNYVDYFDVDDHKTTLYSIKKGVYQEARYRASWLLNSKINNHFIKIENLLKQAPGNLRVYRLPGRVPAKDRTTVIDYINNTPEKINKHIEELKSELIKIIRLDTYV